MQVNIEGKDYVITPHEDKDNIIYEVKTGDQLVCVIGLNGDAEWESNNTCDEGLVKRLGDFIEENEL